MWMTPGTDWADAPGQARGPERFVPYSVARARRAAIEGDGNEGEADGTCQDAVLDPRLSVSLSVDAAFHALLPWSVVLHTHSIDAIAHLSSRKGTEEAARKMHGLDAVVVPYAKPGLPLVHAIRGVMVSEATVFLLRNHGLVVCAGTADEARERAAELERRLLLPPPGPSQTSEPFDVPDGWRAVPEAQALAGLSSLAEAGTLYPDHVISLGPGVGRMGGTIGDNQIAAIVPQRGAILRENATPLQRAMLIALCEVLSRVSDEWGVDPIGSYNEAELIDWGEAKAE